VGVTGSCFGTLESLALLEGDDDKISLVPSLNIDLLGGGIGVEGDEPCFSIGLGGLEGAGGGGDALGPGTTGERFLFASTGDFCLKTSSSMSSGGSVAPNGG
jgi:hypothetical protein